MESKLMSLEVLSSIKGAKESDAVNQLFGIVKNAVSRSDEEVQGDSNLKTAVTIDALREDVVVESTPEERELIIRNFPMQKNGYLMVSKVIED